MNSILQHEKRCWVCGRVTGLEVHHIFAGIANRTLSEKYGLKVWLCHEHHTGKHGAQYDPVLNRQLKQDAQYAFEKVYGHAKWMAVFMKNYL